MKTKYESVILPKQYWEKTVKSDEDIKTILKMLLEKVDQLNERVYESAVRGEDAYMEMLRLRSEVTEQLSSIKERLLALEDRGRA